MPILKVENPNKDGSGKVENGAQVNKIESITIGSQKVNTIDKNAIIETMQEDDVKALFITKISASGKYIGSLYPTGGTTEDPMQFVIQLYGESNMGHSVWIDLSGSNVVDTSKKKKINIQELYFAYKDDESGVLTECKNNIAVNIKISDDIEYAGEIKDTAKYKVTFQIDIKFENDVVFTDKYQQKFKILKDSMFSFERSNAIIEFHGSYDEGEYIIGSKVDFDSDDKDNNKVLQDNIKIIKEVI